jgi:hypothetical protein
MCASFHGAVVVRSANSNVWPSGNKTGGPSARA